VTISRQRLGLLGVAIAALHACTIDENANAAHGCEGCPEGACHLGFCFATGTDQPPVMGDRDAAVDAGGTGGAGGSNGGTGGSNGGTGGSDDGGVDAAAGTDGGAPSDAATGACVPGDFCYEGPPGTRTTGVCRAGEQSCANGELRACVGQVTPSPEVCNGLDDDCDGNIDEDVALGSCATGEPGVCAEGMLSCEAGVLVCRSLVEPRAETCDGTDEDCDGVIDEGTGAACYPMGEDGCTANAAGGFDCRGACRSGMRACVNGTLSPCAGFVTPREEVCGTGTDEDCDGAIDEDCACLDGETQDCYAGPAGTEGVGTCAPGTQTCSRGEFGACTGSVVPATEHCGNEGADDDCDGVLDNVPGRGEPCTVHANLGVCRNGTRQCRDGGLTCVTPEPAAAESACDGRDEDCDGRVDEDFDLLGDELNCGSCERACGAGETCCTGACVVLERDADHCGECGVRCGNAVLCCAGSCVDPATDAAHCGGCGVACQAFVPAAPGETCSCEMGACTSPSGPCTR
jgi:hypothetical protein